MIDFVEEHTVESQKHQKDYYDRGSKECRASSRSIVDDQVLFSVLHTGVSSKLDDRRELGWNVRRVIGPVNFSIKRSDGRNRVVHIDRLQPHIQVQVLGMSSDFGSMSIMQQSILYLMPVVLLVLESSNVHEVGHTDYLQTWNSVFYRSGRWEEPFEMKRSVHCQSMDTSTLLQLDEPGAIKENQNTSVQDNYCSPEKYYPHVLEVLK